MRRLVCLALACAFAATAPLAADAPSLDPTTRVRPTQSLASRLIEEGSTKSPTFRRLVSRLQRSDVIVYVSVRLDMRPSLGGSLRFLGNSATDRFVLVSLNGQNSRQMLVALLGHELQHAVEVADAPDVRNEVALAALYRRIGVRRATESWDSAAAQRVGQTVRAEILQRPVEDRLARHTSSRDDLLLEGGSIEVANR
jgi:hypothetical protein